MMLSGLRSESAESLHSVEYILYFIYSGLASMMLSGLRSDAESLHSVEYITLYFIYSGLASFFVTLTINKILEIRNSSNVKYNIVRRGAAGASWACSHQPRDERGVKIVSLHESVLLRRGM